MININYSYSNVYECIHYAYNIIFMHVSFYIHACMYSYIDIAIACHAIIYKLYVNACIQKCKTKLATYTLADYSYS